MMFYSKMFHAGCSSVALLVALSVSPVWAVVSWTGDTVDPFINPQVFVGIDSFGSLTVDNDTLSYSSFVATIGVNDGGVGDATVVGGTWSAKNVTVGLFGVGSLGVSSGGIVQSVGLIVIGGEVGSSGVVIVDGITSELQAVDIHPIYFDIHVGQLGTGRLEVRAGGMVVNSKGKIGSNAGGSGSAIVSGPGSLWDNRSVLNVGNAGNGELLINLGGTVLSTGSGIGSNGAVSVEGTGSLWNMSGDLGLSGSLSISDGGTVRNLDAGIDGIVSVSGGSLWNSSGGVLGTAIGYFGVGQLDIAGGGIVETALDAAVGDNSGSTGTVNISSGGLWDVTGDAAIGHLAGSVGTANLESGGHWAIGNELRVGDGGSGTLNLDGGTVQTGSLFIANGSTVNFNAGTLNLVGTGTNLTAITVGDGSAGTGTLQLSPGASATISALTLAADGALSLEGGTLTVSTLLDMTAAGSEVQWGGGALTLAGGTVSAPGGFNLSAGGVLNGNGNVNGPVLGQSTATITASGGTLALGDAGSFVGFNYGGTLAVGAGQVDLNSLGYANLGALTTLSAGGTLNAANGVALGSGDNLQGEGTVNGRLTQASGSVIAATGPLELGDATSVIGFVSDGIVDVNDTTVTLNDANEAVLNSAALVTLGSAATGTLSAANGLTLNFGGNITGYGTIDSPDNAATPVINNGNITGNSAIDEITLAGYVKGVGTCDFCNIIGTDAPGFSTATVSRGTVSYNGTLEIEIGGLAAGSGYDQLNHILGLGVADLGGTLDLLLIDGFAPELGDMFQIISATSVSGTFGTINGAYLGGGLGLDVIYGANDVTLEVINVPLGDFNMNGIVNGFDYLKWQRGETQNPLNPLDLADWEANFGGSLVANSSTTVPEPTTPALALAALCLAMSRWRIATQ